MKKLIEKLKYLLIVPDTFDPDDLRRRRVLNNILLFLVFTIVVQGIAEFWDEDLALNALIEGDATVAMEQYAAMSPDLEEPWDAYRAERAEGTDDRLPDGLGKEYAFPYEAGVAFVEAVLAQGGWEAVNEVYSRPPTTTEQILHPDKYLAGEVGDVAGMRDEITVGRFSEPWQLREEP